MPCRGVLGAMLLVGAIWYKRTRDRIRLIEEQYGKFEMSDEWVMARAQVCIE
jgi:hypothetical protein